MKRPTSAQITRQYKTYGLMGGVAIGLLSGVLVSGPHFQDWPVNRSLTLIICFVAGGALIGWTLLAIAVGFLGYGAASGSSSLHDDDASDDEKRAPNATGESDV